EVLAHADQLGQFRSRTEVEARSTLGRALAATGRDDEAEAELSAAVEAMPAMQVDPLLLPSVQALAQWQQAHARGADARVLLGAWIARSESDLAPTHFALGGLHLELAESLATERAAGAAHHLAAARAAFAELPSTHPWQQRLAALSRGL